MEIVQMMAKAGLTLFLVPYVFMWFCGIAEFEPPYSVKSAAVASLLIGMTLGVISLLCWLWLL
jgi:hypothetical protein